MNGFGEMGAAIMDDPRRDYSVRGRLLDAEDHKAVRRFLHVVQNVVEQAGQRVNVLAVKRGDKTAVECLDNPFDPFITGMLLLPDLIATLAETVPLGYHGHELVR